jgi:response regulator RpfG family c-di-GMP phosphodiesterase
MIGSMRVDDSHNTAVVVGDDRGAALKEVSTTLQKAGFVVVTASNGRAALDRCRAQDRPMDLAVIDTAAAGIKAPEIEQQLHEMYPNVRLLFLSDDTPETIHEAGSGGHLRRVLRKPYRRSRFLGRVLEMMEHPNVMRA